MATFINALTERSGYNSRSKDRSALTQRYHSKIQQPLQPLPPQLLKIQRHHQNGPSLTLPPLKTESLVKSRRINVPPISVEFLKQKKCKTTNPETSIADIQNLLETETLKNPLVNHQSKTSFRTKKLSRVLFPLKTNFSSVFSDKSEHLIDQNINQNHNCKLDTQCHDLAETSETEKLQFRKHKENKCLIAVSKKLPFSLQRKPKRKTTQKTETSNANQQIFDLDISVIIDENEGPETPFIRKGSDLEAFFNFA